MSEITLTSALLSAVGALVVAIGYLVRRNESKDKEAKEERKEFRDIIDKQFNQSNQNQNDATRALTELGTIIKSIKK